MPFKAASSSVAHLKALTPEARESLGANLFPIPGFPFRVGRERRLKFGAVRWFSKDRRQGDVRRTNDLYLLDVDDQNHLSDQHFIIHDVGGLFSIEDAGSQKGLIVEGVPLGRAGLVRKAELHHADVVIVGGARSPLVLKFLIG